MRPQLQLIASLPTSPCKEISFRKSQRVSRREKRENHRDGHADADPSPLSLSSRSRKQRCWTPFKSPTSVLEDDEVSMLSLVEDEQCCNDRNVRAVSLSSGSFHYPDDTVADLEDNNIAGFFETTVSLDQRRTNPYGRSVSLPTLTEMSSADSSDADSSDIPITSLPVPALDLGLKDSVLGDMVASLNDNELEIAAHSSYQYAKLVDENAHTGQSVHSSDLNLSPWLLTQMQAQAAKSMAARYYLAEKGIVPDAIYKMKATIAYREDQDIDMIRKCFVERDSSRASIALALQTKVKKYLGDNGRMFIRGYDKQGRAFFHFIVANSPPHSVTDTEGCLEAHYFTLEKAIACTEKRSNGKQTMVNVSVDFRDFKKWHAPPLDVVKHMLIMLKDHYPERLYRVYLVDAPLVFRALWSLIKPFIDPHTKEKFQFVTGLKERQILFEQVMDASQSMSYQRPDGILCSDMDMEEYYLLPYDTAYDE